MRLGFALPQFGDLAREPDGVARFARSVENLGADSVWVGDRLLAPVEPVARYPGAAPDGPAYPEHFRVSFDPLTALTVAAVATSRVRLGTSTLNLPWYPPVALARALTSLDHVSGGRLLVGFGTGWSPDEYRAMGVPWEGRGARLDEYLDVLRAVWTANPAAHEGRLWTLPASHVDLRPVQRPHPPILLAALTGPALRRVGARADGWLPVNLPVRLLARQLTGIRRAAEQAGRDPDGLAAVLRVNVRVGTTPDDVAVYLRGVQEETGIGDAFVDWMYPATSVDHAIELSGRLLELVRGG